MYGEYSVYQFFQNDSYEQVADHVDAQEAACVARRYSTNVAARIGTTNRVIITIGDDCCFEWIHGKGIVFLPNLPGTKFKKD